MSVIVMAGETAALCSTRMCKCHACRMHKSGNLPYLIADSHLLIRTDKPDAGRTEKFADKTKRHPRVPFCLHFISRLYRPACLVDWPT